jgi:hypothetical protein
VRERDVMRHRLINVSTYESTRTFAPVSDSISYAFVLELSQTVECLVFGL